MTPRPIVFFAMIACMAIADAQEPAASLVPSDSEIRGILVQRIDEFHQSVGIVVGMIGPNGRKVVSYGAAEKGDARALNGDTVFEIGSVTKVFTSLLLADMVQRGEVALTDPVAKYLPPGVKVPQRNGRQITLEDLATHTSGLPRLPSNLKPKDAANPYADYTVAQMYEFLASYELPRDIGTKYEYSNLGGGLLGHALALRAGQDYESLVRSRITAPLGMKDTSIALSPAMKARLAAGYDGQLNRAANWDLPTLAGAGRCGRPRTICSRSSRQTSDTRKRRSLQPWPRCSRCAGQRATRALRWHWRGTSSRPRAMTASSSGTTAGRADIARSLVTTRKHAWAWWRSQTLQLRRESTTSASTCCVRRRRCSMPPRSVLRKSAKRSRWIRSCSTNTPAAINWRPISF